MVQRRGSGKRARKKGQRTFRSWSSADPNYTDGSGSTTFTITPVLLPTTLVLTPIPQSVANHFGVSTTAILATMTDAEPGDQVGSFQPVTLDWGDGTQSHGSLQVDPAASGTFDVISGGHVYAKPGSYLLSIEVDADDGRTVSAGTTVKVTPITALVTAGAAITTTPAQDLGGTILATFVAHGAVASDFTATVNWGDGSVQTAGVVDPGTAGRRVSVDSERHRSRNESPFHLPIISYR